MLISVNIKLILHFDNVSTLVYAVLVFEERKSKDLEVLYLGIRSLPTFTSRLLETWSSNFTFNGKVIFHVDPGSSHLQF